MKVLRFWGAGSFGLPLLVAAVFFARTAEAQRIFGSDPEGLKKTDNLQPADIERYMYDP